MKKNLAPPPPSLKKSEIPKMPGYFTISKLLSDNSNLKGDLNYEVSGSNIKEVKSHF